MIAAVTPRDEIGPVCGVCARDSRLVYGRDLYPHRRDLVNVAFWSCKCGASVGCHPGTTRPLGTPASRTLRTTRRELHEIIDPLWRDHAPVHHGARSQPDFERLRKMARQRVYDFLAQSLQIDPKDCHVAQFGAARCAAAIEIMRGVTYAAIDDFATRRLRRGIS